MKKVLPWIAVLVLGLIWFAPIGGAYVLGSFFAPRPDPSYQLVAVSWGTHTSSPNLWIYQVQIVAQDQDRDGILEVSGKACIGSSSYYHDFGPLGTAADRGEAIRRFGIITWENDKVTIGGSDGIVASLMRNQLERHR